MLLANNDLQNIIDTTAIDMDIPMPIQQWQLVGRAQIDVARILQLADIFPGV